MDINSKINNYLEDRMIYFIMLAPLEEKTYDKIVNYQKDKMPKFLQKICDVQEKTMNCFPAYASKNIINFINRSGVRFSDGHIIKENNNIINNIISNANCPKDFKTDFIVEESKKFFTFENKKYINECKLSDFLDLEKTVYTYIVDMLFASNEMFSEKYTNGYEGVGNESTLYVINYLLNDFPTIFENEQFYGRTASILGYNKDLCQDNDVELLDMEGSQLSKRYYRKFKKSFDKKNNSILENILKNIG